LMYFFQKIGLGIKVIKLFFSSSLTIWKNRLERLPQEGF